MGQLASRHPPSYLFPKKCGMQDWVTILDDILDPCSSPTGSISLWTSSSILHSSSFSSICTTGNYFRILFVQFQLCGVLSQLHFYLHLSVSPTVCGSSLAISGMDESIYGWETEHLCPHPLHSRYCGMWCNMMQVNLSFSLSV